MLISEKNRKLVGKVGSVRKTSFTYRTEKYGIKKNHATSRPSSRQSWSGTVENRLVGGELVNLFNPM
jgi:hypothetical protein